ncbi:hypothetical protein [Aliiroseovarius subalbicans]|uniref:hypothetical protein n=1 Tax=Aliiroseovarius subalbicans TaxID=2925840 RepID=UPI001F5790B7|nr:hypothetical protein [Aliiroseovarius subalbicans]MCI2399014.1 hypothetical protein [Aliiroseovarius subalbicans]
MEISGTSPFGGHASVAAQMPTRTPPDVPKIDESRHSDQAQADTRSKQQNDTAGAARDLQDARQGKEVPTGPPPTFEMTALEVEADLQAAIARMEAKRNQAANADGVKARDPAPEAKARPDEAPPPSEVTEKKPAERVAVAQLEQPYDAKPTPDAA